MTGMATTGSYEGADVDGLDRLSQEFSEAAQITNDVKMACEVIVAAASFFGPFGAAFVSYVKTVVIPWLTKIAEALQLMSKVLGLHSQAQKTASSSASLPSYSTPLNLPPGSTTDYPVVPLVLAVAVAEAGGLSTPAGGSVATVAAAASVDGARTGEAEPPSATEQAASAVELADAGAKGVDAAKLVAAAVDDPAAVLRGPISAASEAVEGVTKYLPSGVEDGVKLIGAVSVPFDAAAADAAFGQGDYATGVEKLGSAGIGAAGLVGAVEAPVAAGAGVAWWLGTQGGHGINRAMEGTTFGDNYQANMQEYYQSISTFGPAVAIPAGMVMTPIEMLRAGGQSIGLLPEAETK